MFSRPLCIWYAVPTISSFSLSLPRNEYFKSQPSKSTTLPYSIRHVDIVFFTNALQQITSFHPFIKLQLTFRHQHLSLLLLPLSRLLLPLQLLVCLQLSAKPRQYAIISMHFTYKLFSTRSRYRKLNIICNFQYPHSSLSSSSSSLSLSTVEFTTTVHFTIPRTSVALFATIPPPSSYHPSARRDNNFH